MDPDYSSLLRQVEQLNNLPTGHASKVLDVTQRRDLRKKLRKLNQALEDPGETVDRILYSSADVVVTCIAVELNLFKILVESDKPKTSRELAELTGADETLLARILRYLAGIDAIGKAGPNLYTATEYSNAFTTTQGTSGIRFFVHGAIPAWCKFPEKLAASGYRNPGEAVNFGTQLGHNTTDNFFEWIAKNPSLLRDFNLLMTSQQEGRAHWLDFYPFEEQIYSGSKHPHNESIIFVDVGGSVGHEIERVRKRYPALTGRMVLQDLPQTVEKVTSGPGMEVMAHDFFTPQPCQGARAYFFGKIFHGWPDSKCQVILQHTCAAMTPGFSKILINEFIVPSQDENFFPMQFDFNIMAVGAGLIRTEEQWHQLLGSVGLKIVRIWTEDPSSESIIEVMLA